MKSKEILDFALKAIDDRHGEDTAAYNMRGISILADYYVVTSADSNRQLHAIVNAIVEAAHENHDADYHVEGTHDSNWLLVDLGDVIVNVFTKDVRAFYDLEKLWTNGKQLVLTKE